jgi:hypothetical protein
LIISLFKLNIMDQKDLPIIPVRVNVPDPEDQNKRCLAVTDDDGQYAHTSKGQHVRITNEDGSIREDVIVFK